MVLNYSLFFFLLGVIMAKNPRAGTVNKTTKTTTNKSTSNAKPTNTTVAKDAPNFWVRRGDGKAITIDVYKDVKGIDALNAGSDSDSNKFSNKLDLSLAKGLKGGLSILDKVKRGAAIVAGVRGVLQGGGSPLDKLANISGLSKTVLTNLNIPEDSDIFKKITTATSTVVTLANTGKRIQCVDWGNIQSVSKLLADYTKDNDLFKISDLGAEAAFAATIIHEGVKNGFPNSFKAVADTISNSAVLKSVIGDLLPITTAVADLYNLKDMINYFDGEFQTMFPNVLGDLSRQYRKDWFSDDDDKTTYGNFIDVANVYTTEWWLTDRGKGKILNGDVLTIASDDFRNMFNNGMQANRITDIERILGKTQADKQVALDYKLLAITKVFPRSTVNQELKKHFPKTLIEHHSVIVP